MNKILEKLKKLVDSGELTSEEFDEVASKLGAEVTEAKTDEPTSGNPESTPPVEEDPQETPTEEPPADEPPTEEPPVENPPTEEPPVDETPAGEQTPAAGQDFQQRVMDLLDSISKRLDTLEQNASKSSPKKLDEQTYGPGYRTIFKK